MAKVNGLRTAEQRATVVYVGRAFAGWPQSPWHNPFKARPGGPVGPCLGQFREHAMSQPDSWWADLWAACRRGDIPLGCWCLAWDGEGDIPSCHAAILADELSRRFIDEKGAI